VPRAPLAEDRVGVSRLGRRHLEEAVGISVEGAGLGPQVRQPDLARRTSLRTSEAPSGSRLSGAGISSLAS
jgi:hypothetical protein